MKMMKKAMTIAFTLAVFATPVLSSLPALSASAAATSSISDARKLAVGTTVTLDGVVTRSVQSSASNINNDTVYIQDGTAGIGVYLANTYNNSSFAPGTKLEVTGAIQTSDGMTEIIPTSSANVQNVGTDTVPAPISVTPSTLGSAAYQGELVKVSGAVLSAINTNSNHTILKGNVSAVLRDPTATTLPSATFHLDETIDATGIAGVYNGSPELLLQDETTSGPTVSITKTAAPTPTVSVQIPGLTKSGTTYTTSDTTPEIVVAYNSDAGFDSTDLSNVAVTLDSTSIATPSDYGVDYSPASAISLGQHTVTVTVTDNAVPSQTATLSFPFTVTNASIDISAARALTPGTTATVKGVVTKSIQSGATKTNNNTFYVQDTTGGIGVYKSGAFNVNSYTAGHVLEVTGVVTNYSGMLELVPSNAATDIKDDGAGTPVTAKVITIQDLNANTYNGQLVKIVNASLTAIGTNSNNTILQNSLSATLRNPASTTLTGFTLGEAIDATGIAGSYNNAGELLTQSQADIQQHQ